MQRRQTSLPRAWFIVDSSRWEPDELLRRLPRGTGILVLRGAESARLRRLARIRGMTLVEESSGDAARVHDIRELRQALHRRTALILLSPVFRTESHPDWRPIPRMRAAALAWLGKRSLVALGGMNAKRFKRVERLGFQGWAGISAWAGATMVPSRE